MPQPARPANLLAVLSGRELTELIRSHYLADLRQSLAPSPIIAIERIVSAFGNKPTRLGTNVSGIAKIREAIWASTQDPAVPNGLAIIAPHTHWDSDLPTIISVIDNGYRIGPAAPLDDGTYTPVSFVFSQKGPLPFEWADESIAFERAALERLWSAIKDVCMAVAEHNWPLGLSLNFRFKDLFEEEPVSTLEYAETSDGTGASPAVIRRVGEAVKSQDDTNFEQVAWHAYCDAAYSLDPEEQTLLTEIRRRLDAIQSVTELQTAVEHLSQEMSRLVENPAASEADSADLLSTARG